MKYNPFVMIFEKSTAQRFIDCIKNHQPFEPADKEKGWMGREAMILIGVLLCALLGTFLERKKTQRQSEAVNEEQEQDKISINYMEYDEADAEIAVNQCCCAVCFSSELVRLISRGEYDIKYAENEKFQITPKGEQPGIGMAHRPC